MSPEKSYDLLVNFVHERVKASFDTPAPRALVSSRTLFSNFASAYGSPTWGRIPDCSVWVSARQPELVAELAAVQGAPRCGPKGGVEGSWHMRAPYKIV